MNDRQRVAKKPLSAVGGNGLRRVVPDTAPAFIASVCRRTDKSSNLRPRCGEDKQWWRWFRTWWRPWL